MRERPIEFTCFGIERSKWKCTIIDAGHWNNFGIVSAREYLIGGLKVLIGQSFFNHGYAATAQQSDHALAGDAGEKSAIRDWRVHHAVLGHENVGRGQLGDIS